MKFNACNLFLHLIVHTYTKTTNSLIDRTLPTLLQLKYLSGKKGLAVSNPKIILAHVARCTPQISAVFSENRW